MFDQTIPFGTVLSSLWIKTMIMIKSTSITSQSGWCLQLAPERCQQRMERGWWSQVRVLSSSGQPLTGPTQLGCPTIWDGQPDRCRLAWEFGDFRWHRPGGWSCHHWPWRMLYVPCLWHSWTERHEPLALAFQHGPWLRG